MHFVHPKRIEFFHQTLINHYTWLDNHFASLLVDHFASQYAAQHTIAERRNDVAAFDDRAHYQTIGRAAVVFGDDKILRNIDQPPGEVTGIRGFECRIRQTLAGAVRGSEVLHHTQAFTEVCSNRRLDD